MNSTLCADSTKCWCFEIKKRTYTVLRCTNLVKLKLSLSVLKYLKNQPFITFNLTFNVTFNITLNTSKPAKWQTPNPNFVTIAALFL